MRQAALIYSDDLATHVLSDEHPMRPVRLSYMHQLARAAGFLDAPNSRTVAPRPATDEELALAHSDEYIEAVKKLDSGDGLDTAAGFGFGPGDNPVYPGLFEAQTLSAGSAMVAVEQIAGDVDTAFAPAGGLHHAMPGRASGFCVFNDPVMVIRSLAAKGLRIAYVDIDCHHGDGVQHAFYDTDTVLTISLHESGQFLFPGTGFTNEIGAGAGEGYSANLPLAPYTGDEDYARAFDAIVPPLVQAFQPDVLVTQLGIDTHMLDPITHLRLTAQGFAGTVAKLGGLIQESGKWIALGGGGYDMGAVARGWAMAYAVMSEQDIPDRIPESFDSPGNSTNHLEEFADPQPPESEDAVRKQISAFTDRSVEQLQALLFPRFGIS
jgi:acetoin utilization protein AcuC